MLHTIRVTPASSHDECWDCAVIITKMYENWAASNKFEAYVARSSGGSLVVTINAPPEALDAISHDDGLHRIVRISPRDSLGRRHTSFARVAINGSIETDRIVRSYIFDPYRRVKDEATGKETADIVGVMSGDLSFLEQE